MSQEKENGNGKIVSTGAGSAFDLRSLFVGAKSAHGIDRRAVAKLGVEHPVIASILGGSEATGETPEVAPGSITFFVREGKIRFSANVKSADTTIIGEVADALTPWESIEYALMAGEVSSKRYSARTPSLGKEEDIPH